MKRVCFQNLMLPLFGLISGCGGLTENHLPSSSSEVSERITTTSSNYVGCYTDSSTRSLPNQLASSGATIESCLNLAQAQNLAYAGVQYGGQCFGGNTLGSTKVADSQCNMPCAANSGEICGGSWLNSIYSTAKTDTLGETTVFTGTDSGNANLLIVQNAALSKPATIQSISFYVKTAAGQLTLGLYDATGSSGGPGNLVASTATFTPAVGWNSQAVIKPVALAAGNYWLAYLSNNNALSFVNAGAVSSDTYYLASNQTSLATPFPLTGTTSGHTHWSLYATLSVGSATSPNGTVVLAGSGGQIVDSSGNAWTLVGGVVMNNGSAAGYSANVTEIAYVNGVVWQENNSGLWWPWNGSAWTGSGVGNPLPAATPSPTPTPTSPPSPTPTSVSPSPNNTVVLAGSGGKIVDSSGSIWTLVGGVVMENGTAAGYSANVAEIAYVNGVVWQENSSGLWWPWSGTTWLGNGEGSPLAGGTPLPSSSPTPTPTPTHVTGKPGLKYFGLHNTGIPLVGPGLTNPWPDTNNIPLSVGPAIGTQVPMNIIRDDGLTQAAQWGFFGFPSYWYAELKTAKAFAQAHGVALMGGFYNEGNGNQSWSYLQTCAQNMAPYLDTGYPVFLNIDNEIMGNNTGSPFGSLMSQSPFSDLGGAGATGIDGFINYIKKLRAIFPPNVKLGLSDYNVLDDTIGGGTYKLATAISVYNTAKANGAPMDFLAAEGYWMNYKYEGYSSPVDMINSASNAFGSATGVPIIFSEWTPMATEKGKGYYPTQIAAWQAMLGAMATNQYVIGVTGPWGGIRYSQIWRDGYGSEALNWMWNDTSSNADGDPNGDGNIGPGAVTTTLKWLQTWVPANVH